MKWIGEKSECGKWEKYYTYLHLSVIAAFVCFSIPAILCLICGLLVWFYFIFLYIYLVRMRPRIQDYQSVLTNLIECAQRETERGVMGEGELVLLLAISIRRFI